MLIIIGMLFMLQAEEVEKAIDIDGFELHERKVFVIWKWSWCDSFSDLQGDSFSQSDADENDLEDILEVPETPPDSDNEEKSCEPITHCIVFKCIGVTKDPHIQEVLSLVSKELKQGRCVNVELVKEPTNPVDSLAVAFMCTLENKKEKLGYVVREALDAVHSALNNDEIVFANVAWARFLIHWSRSGPGWYAGVSVTKIGEWPATVVRCSSTIK